MELKLRLMVTDGNYAHSQWEDVAAPYLPSLHQTLMRNSAAVSCCACPARSRRRRDGPKGPRRGCTGLGGSSEQLRPVQDAHLC